MIMPGRSVLLAAAVALLTALAGCSQGPASSQGADAREYPVEKTEQQWREELTEQQYRVLREKATEPAFTGRYTNEHTPGVYRCAGCGQELFTSDAKYDSGCGWPSFYEPAESDHVATEIDRSHGMVRTEILCSRCGGHLGHVFEDGPQPTGLRYCVNSASLTLEPESDAQQDPQTE